MHSVGRLAAAIIGCFILTLVWVTPAAIHADDWNLKTRFMVNQPFEVPGMVLQPNTRYIIKLLDSPSERRVVQIYNDDESKQLTMFMAISDERQEVADNTVFSFIESEPGYPVPIKEWFYPGRLIGLEFIYPKKQALEIARHAREPIQATDDVDLHDLAAVRVEAVEPIGKGFATSATSAANVTRTETPQFLGEKPAVTEESTQTNAPPSRETESTQIAQNDTQNNTQNNTESSISNTTTEKDIQSDKAKESSSINSEQSNQTPVNQTAQNNTQEDRELPRTAGELPLIALIGALCIGAGVGMKVLSAKSQMTRE